MSGISPIDPSFSLFIYPFEINTPNITPYIVAEESDIESDAVNDFFKSPDIRPTKLKTNSFSENDDSVVSQMFENGLTPTRASDTSVDEVVHFSDSAPLFLQSNYPELLMGLEKEVTTSASDASFNTYENTNPSISVSLINEMDKLRKWDPFIPQKKPWIIRDFFLLFSRKDMQVLLNTSKNIAYCILTDPVLKEKYRISPPRGINFYNQKNLHPIHNLHQYFLELIAKPRDLSTTNVPPKENPLNQPGNPIVNPLPSLPEEDSCYNPNEIVWTISELPFGSRVAPKAPFIQRIDSAKTNKPNNATTVKNRFLDTVGNEIPTAVLSTRTISNKTIRSSQHRETSKKETVWTIYKRASAKKVRTSFIRPIAIPQRVSMS